MPAIDTGEVGVGWENQSDLPDWQVLPTVREIASQLQSWVRENRAQRGQNGFWMRTKYATKDTPYEVMRTAKRAVQDDDIVSAAFDVTEALTLQGVGWEDADVASADILNQISADIDLDTYARSAYRDLATYSQVVSAVWWETREMKPRVRSGAKRTKTGAQAPGRKSYSLVVPTKIITLDPMHVVPIGNRYFGEDRLAWHATDELLEAWAGVDNGTVNDATLSNLFIGRYTPSEDEKEWMGDAGIDTSKLMELNPRSVWRHTATRSKYELFPDFRMRSIFRLLDMKQQLMESDRVMLVGAANYLLIVKKGTDAQPGTAKEIAALQQNFSVMAKLPVIVSDHRLEIEIVSPKLDLTLVDKKYDLLDGRILANLFRAPEVNSGARGDQTAGTTSRMMARHLENQRHMLRRSIERHIGQEVWRRNRRALDDFSDQAPSLVFMPRHVQLDNDSQFTQLVMAARQQRDLSRESFLEFMGYDQAAEARRVEREAVEYDDIFKTVVPFSKAGDGGDGEPSAVAGARGGRPQGGGSSPRSAQGQVKKRTASGAPSVGGS